MSHASGLVRFEDGTLRHFLYDGTNDFPLPKLWASSDAAWGHRREEDRHKKCTCGRPPESVEAFTFYGRGFEWPTTACRRCRVIVDCTTPSELGTLHGVPDWLICLRQPPVAQKTEQKEKTDQEKQDQRIYALWAADCAERVLPYFEERHPEDDRPRKALDAARAWANDGLAMSQVRAAAFAAWIAARAAAHPAAKAAAFAAGHAAAVGYTSQEGTSFTFQSNRAGYAGHYARAAAATVGTQSAELDWQRSKLPERLCREIHLDRPHGGD
ncbi:MAG: putative immunity protein [Verrucomicrobiia bacterium]